MNYNAQNTSNNASFIKRDMSILLHIHFQIDFEQILNHALKFIEMINSQLDFDLLLIQF